MKAVKWEEASSLTCDRKFFVCNLHGHFSHHCWWRRSINRCFELSWNPSACDWRDLGVRENEGWLLSYNRALTAFQRRTFLLSTLISSHLTAWCPSKGIFEHCPYLCPFQLPQKPSLYSQCGFHQCHDHSPFVPSQP